MSTKRNFKSKMTMKTILKTSFESRNNYAKTSS